MCAARGVSVGGFYDAQARLGATPHARVARDEQLRVAVRVVFRKFRTRYGAPRVHSELRQAGVRVAKHRIARFMHRRISWLRGPGPASCARRTRPTARRSPRICSTGTSA